MTFNFDNFKKALELSDKVLMTAICEDLIHDLYQKPASFTIAQMEGIIADLRSMRMFKMIIRLCDVAIQMKLTSFKICRQLAQSLIEENLFTTALTILDKLIDDTEPVQTTPAMLENREAYGLKGRLYKQLYVTVNDPLLPHSQDYLKKSLEAYHTIYQKDTTRNIWHGINTVAVAARGLKDKIELMPEAEIQARATTILDIVTQMDAAEEAKAFDLAVAMEACVALKNFDSALQWMEKYIQRPEAHAFELASTLRQLTEVWNLGQYNEPQRLIPLLRGALLKKEGGILTLGTEEIQNGIYDEKKRVSNPEKVFGIDDSKTYEWYMKGASRCLPVARIGRETSKGLGTGFLLEGELLHASLKNELVLLTNAHVVSDDQTDREALRPNEAIITFEVLGLQQSFENPMLFFTSPYKELDVTILRFSPDDNKVLIEKLAEKKIDLFVVSNKVLKKNTDRIYIIGHPAGGTLQLSLQDNALLDLEGPLLHYRTPTVGGSSGSPVFDDDWKLIGIHHAGGNYMRKLNNATGMYQANEGIMIQHIIDAVKQIKPAT